MKLFLDVRTVRIIERKWWHAFVYKEDINIRVVLSTLSQTLQYDIQSENDTWKEEQRSSRSAIVNEPKMIKSQVRAAQGFNGSKICNGGGGCILFSISFPWCFPFKCLKTTPAMALLCPFLYKDAYSTLTKLEIAELGCVIVRSGCGLARSCGNSSVVSTRACTVRQNRFRFSALQCTLVQALYSSELTMVMKN